MKKIKSFFIIILSLCIIALTGCLKKPTEEVKTTDDCVTVQLPEGSAVKDLFQFKSTDQIFVAGADRSIYIGYLEDGNSVVWDAGDEFLYVKGEAKDASIIYYMNQLREDPITYNEFQEQYNNEKGE